MSRRPFGGHRKFLRCLLGCFCCFLSCTGEKGGEDHHKKQISSGEVLAKKYCASCHLFPEPQLLDKETWTDDVLPAMAHRFGIYRDRSRDSLLEKGIGRRIVERANVFPSKQTISDLEWEAIRKYYSHTAPQKLTNHSETLTVHTTPLFEERVPPLRILHPAISALAFDSIKRQFYLADCSQDGHTSIIILDEFFKPLTTLGLPHPVSNLAVRNDTLYMLSMGHFVPSDEPVGQLIRAIKNANGEYEGYQRVLRNLKRPVDVAYGDLDGDGTDEIVVCEFGNHTGNVSIFFKTVNASFEKKVLLDAPGAVKVILEDMNNDSRKDIVVLMSQGDEGLDIYFNLGEGDFERKRLLRFPAVYGSVSFALNDINNDGYKDIIYVNGDNADASRILKPYHGIRVFINDQHSSFALAYFFPLNGAYDAVVKDYDRDGDLDIAAIAFFADFLHDPGGGFVYLENKSNSGRLEFSPAHIKGAPNGRWITMLSADFNRDSYEDILLGSFTSMLMSGDSLIAWRNRIGNSGQPLLMLLNKTVQ